MKKIILSVIAVVFIAGIIFAGGLHVGMPSAVKSKVKELNKKVLDKFGERRRIKWTYSTGVSIYYSSAALSEDENRVYFGTSYHLGSPPGSGHGLYCLNSTSGALIWKYDLGSSEVRSSPAIAPDGTIYFVVETRTPSGEGWDLSDWLYAITSSGDYKWKYSIPRGFGGSINPSISEDGTVYVIGNDGLHAINPNGTFKWKYPSSGEPNNSPAIDSDGTIYFVAGATLYAVNPDNSTKWQVPLPGVTRVQSSLCIGSYHIYVGSEEGVLHAVDISTGGLDWSYSTASASEDRRIRSTPAIAPDGTIYFGTKVSPGTQVRFYALNPGGKLMPAFLKWIFEPHDRSVDAEGNDIYSSPAIGSDGTIYFGCETRFVYALNPDGTLKWKCATAIPTMEGQKPFDMTWPSPAIKSDGTIFIGNMAGNFYAIRSDSLGLSANSPWPKFHHDNQNTGGKWE